MAENIFPEMKRRLLALSGTSPADVAGASDEEIRELEIYAGGNFPLVYRQFLEQMGRLAGNLFRGSEATLDPRFRLRLREPAERLLERAQASFKLPADAFVFLMSQGYQFSFFHLNEGDDSPVYHYLEGQAAPTRLADHLSEYFMRCLEAHEKRVKARARSGKIDSDAAKQAG